jgi:hypothetical protein
MDEPPLINAASASVSQRRPSARETPFLRSSVANITRRIIQGSHANPEPPKVRPLDIQGRLVLRAHHSPWPGLCKNTYFEMPNTLISDLPSDYLSLYARAHTVYSDRVHACIAALSYGSRAMLFANNEPRLRMFERLHLREIADRPVRIDPERLLADKRRETEFLARVM